jgi:hypothetical protein
MVQRTATPQIVDRLAERWAERPAANCMLGREPHTRVGGACSACRPKMEFDLDHTIAQLVNAGIFDGASACPHRAIVSHLVAGFLFGPEAVRARNSSADDVDAVVELKAALKHVRRVLGAASVKGEDIQLLADDEDAGVDFAPLVGVMRAEPYLADALSLFQRQRRARKTGPRGRRGRLEVQGVAGAMLRAWGHLTGSLPGKNNAHFHELLRAATTTMFGGLDPEPDWEGVTRLARHKNQEEGGGD